MLTEWDTRHLPYEQVEVSYARNRLPVERPPIPVRGDQVFYRRTYWDQIPVAAVIVEVQDLNDRLDPNLWMVVRNTFGAPIQDQGVTRYTQVPDPWPEVKLLYKDEQEQMRYALTRESRMRGSPGWLPLNWRMRPVYLPQDLLMMERVSLRPVNVPFAEFGG
jgi:hypothetical protein